MRNIILAVVVFTALWFVNISHTSAQSCSPRPNIQVSVQGDTVSVIAQSVITQIVMNPDSAGNARVVLPGNTMSVPLPVTIHPNSVGYSFGLRSLNPVTPVTVPISVTDGCGPWNSFVGAGGGLISTAIPTFTITPLPTPPPVATLIPTPPAILPTSTPVQSPNVGFSPFEVHAGNNITVTWAGRLNPLVNDFVAITTLGGAVQGPPTYTSSCASVTASPARGSGSCQFQVPSWLAAGQYLIRYYANNNTINLLATAPHQLKVVSAGQATFGKGQVWGTAARYEIPEISSIGGFIGFQALLSAGDPGYVITGASYHHLGLADFGLLGDNFIEVGSERKCAFTFCVARPYMSWMDSLGLIHQNTWDGNNGFPNVQLHDSHAVLYQFKVYEVSATRWTAEWCNFNAVCCPLWVTGIPCSEPKQQDSMPITYHVRFPWLFAGSETQDSITPAGVTNIETPSYCCHIGMNAWTPLECWHYPWKTYNPQSVYAEVTDCIPYSGWYTVSGYK